MGAHPRSRGENFPWGGEGACWWGSSPLTRGKLARLFGIPPAKRLIPAHAGKTLPDPGPGERAGAHPRSRGENRKKRSKTLSHARLIPAHAGKTRKGL